ncbi:aminopeptidase P family protein [Aerococcaceae bacterium DSM 111020]|nr:aminopeptidase P family protein [Aerococcaceae bacterium DSM 111020]
MKMNEQKVSNQLISDPTSIRYFIDYYTEPGERLLLLLVHTNGSAELFVNRLFPRPKLTPALRKSIHIIYYNDGEAILEKIAEKLYPGTSGIDKNWPAHFLLDLLQIEPQLQPLNNSYLIDDLRGIKSLEEQNIMREASRINDQAMARLIDLLPFNYSENELKQQLSNIYASLNQTGFSFDPIIAYGPNGADPHHTTSAHKPDYGDTVVIDIGAMHQNYASDMTRTVFYGHPSDFSLQVYDTVLKANQAAIKAVKPGVPLSEIDLTARKIIEDAGFGKFFTHRTGHFIGQECHEAGDVSQFNHSLCQEGQIFSIEPGIYIPGHLGVRIEDLVLVTANGCEVLNHYPKDPIIIEPSID